MCGFVNCFRRYLEGKPVVQTAPPKEEQKEGKTIEKKKAALEFLDEEIQQLNKSKKDAKKDDKFSEMQKNILQGLGGKSEKTIEADEGDDLDFNDLEISFE